MTHQGSGFVPLGNFTLQVDGGVDAVLAPLFGGIASFSGQIAWQCGSLI